MPAPFAVDSNRTGLIVWQVDDNGNVIQSGGTLMPGMATAAGVVLSSSLTGDAFPRFQILADGTHLWSSGAAAPDVQLSRISGNLLGTTDTALRLNRATAGGQAMSIRATGDVNNRWQAMANGIQSWGDGTNPVDTNLYRVAADTLGSDDDFALQVAGKGYRVKEGANAKMGTATLVAGAATVANTSVTATSRILLTSQVDGGAPGFLRVSARVVGTSFTITSGSGTDTSTVAWFILEPS